MHSRTLLLLFGMVFGLVVLAGVAGVLYPVVIAKLLISDLQDIERHPISEAWLRQWADERGGDYSCDGSRCRAEVEVRNTFLSTLGLARAAGFIAAVTLEEGRLVHVTMILADVNYEARPIGALTLAGVDYGSVGEPGSAPSVPEVRSDPGGKLPSVSYGVTSSAAPGDLALAYKFNVWCLARVGRCANPEQAPEIWALVDDR